MFNRLKNHYKTQQFQPNFLGIFLNPFYLSRKAIYIKIVEVSKFLRKKLGENYTVLDVGCGQKPYAHLFETKNYIGLEVDSPENRANKKADVFYDGENFPFESNQFDCVISSQVLEHVQNEYQFIQEISRVLKKDGYLILSVPFVWDEHEQPHDYRRYTSIGLESFLSQYGFSVIKNYKTVNDFSLIFQLINAYFYKKLITKNKFINLVLNVCFFSLFNLLGIITSFLLPKNNDLFLDNIVLVQKLKT